ncbi:hypothetical protein DAEQUDRAFT_682045 [Daedalea quercina L-15889]|uniref:Uncharacterized protein n=1 Tax=Daedalea quercina L-15889 TaxID=1314783 RepID=A0A165U1Y3_9APHY|nr:hypothetical protein DAEQUDRAFT_682045 [Daedalea quercina L-15889]
MSSELSNALNPNVITARRSRPPRPIATENAVPAVEQPQPPPRPFVPHRSELELAIAEPQPRPAPSAARPGSPVSRQTAAVQKLLRVLSSSKEAAELERKRRQAWEKDQEARLAQQQAEMERQMSKIRQELSLLRAETSLQSSRPSTVAVSPAASIPSPIGDRNPAPFASGLPPGVYPASFPYAPSTTQPSLNTVAWSLSHSPAPLLTPPVDSIPTTHSDGSPPEETDFRISHQLGLHSQSSSNALITPEHTPTLPAAQPRTTAANASPHSPAFVESSSTLPYATPSHSPFISVPDAGTLSSTNEEALTSTDERRSDTSSSVSVRATLRPPLVTREGSLSPSPSVLGKRRTALHSGSEGSDDSDIEATPESANSQYRKRQNGHDKRCLTIQHAMRAHILRLMQLSDDKSLPNSHIEGEPLPMGGPVRFIWEKTSKQSSHNAAMKRRIIVDLQANRAMYKHVPEKEFARKNLENVFDQAFTTLRQKFRAQRDTTAAFHNKRREDQKALKARRLSRKKIKLTNRIEARKRLDTFTHPAFDGALQQDCMSSEESCDDDNEGNAGGRSQNRTKVLRIRGLPWRSLRLQRFYVLLDEEDQADKGNKPKRGIGRMERRVGPDKDPQILPPVSASRWMISKRWIRVMQCMRPDLAPTLATYVSASDEINWDECVILGAESDDEAELQEVVRLGRHIPVSETSSLQYALNLPS